MTYKIELLNRETGAIAIAELQLNKPLNLDKLRQSLPGHYQFLTFWIE
jgi:hypothetical protein